MDPGKGEIATDKFNLDVILSDSEQIASHSDGDLPSHWMIQKYRTRMNEIKKRSSRI